MVYPEGEHKIDLRISINSIYNDLLVITNILHTEVNLDFRCLVSSNIETEDFPYWFDWTLCPDLYNYIKSKTVDNSLVWVPVKRFVKQGARVYNEICSDNMSKEDFSSIVFLSSIHMDEFENWLFRNNKYTFLSKQIKDSNYELVHWNLYTLSGSMYEITQLYIIGKEDELRSITLHYSFNEEDISREVTQNAYFYSKTTFAANEHENIKKQIGVLKCKMHALTFIKTYNFQYRLGILEKDLDMLISKYQKKIEILSKKEEELRKKELLKSALGDIIKLTDGEIRTLSRKGIKTVADAIEKDGKYYRRFLGKIIVKLLILLDEQGLRIADADKSKYPKIENYFKHLFVCDSCGKELDYKNRFLYRRWLCPDCLAKEKRLLIKKAIDVKVSISRQIENISQGSLFKFMLVNNTSLSIKLSVDDISLFYNSTLQRGIIDNGKVYFEDYCFPKTVRTFEAFWETGEYFFNKEDYLAIYLTDKSNNKKYFFKLKNINNENDSFVLDDYYECDIDIKS